MELNDYLITIISEVFSNPLLYQIVSTLAFLILMNAILAKKLNDNNIPIIPRIFYIRENNIFNRTLPMRLEFVKEFLNALQEKRNMLLTELRNGRFIRESSRNNIKELYEVEKKLHELLLYYFKCDYFNRNILWIHYHNYKKVLKSYLSILMKIN